MKSISLSVLFATLLSGAIACQQPTAQNETSSLSSTELPGSGKTVQGVHANLPEEEFQTAIVGKALEQLGYEVEKPAIVTPTIMFVALADGDVDYTAAHLERLHANFYEKNGGGEQLVKSGEIVSGILQGYQIDKKTADKHNITSIDQFKDPEIAKLFDSDRDGKADLAGCPVGWGCELVIEHHLDTYGLKDTVQHNQGEYNLIIADTITRYKEGESVLFYTWIPLWVEQILKPEEDTIWLEVPYTDLPEEQGDISEKDTTAKGKNLGFAIDRYWITANKEFIAANPAAKKLFELIKIPVEDISVISKRVKEGEDSPEDIVRLAEEWIETNRDTFDSWIEGAMKVKSES